MLMNGIQDDAGMYRRHGVRIVGANVPTANYVRVPKLIKSIIVETERGDLDILNHISMVHSRFEKIHPFSDGNSRIGRLIITAMLLRKNLPIAIINQKDKNIYYKYLQKAQLEEDLSLLGDFVCETVLEGYRIIES